MSPPGFFTTCVFPEFVAIFSLYSSLLVLSNMGVIMCSLVLVHLQSLTKLATMCDRVPAQVPAPLNDQRSSCYIRFQSARPNRPQKLRLLPFVIVHCTGQYCGHCCARCFQARLEPCDEGALTATPKRNLQASSPRCNENKREKK